MYFHWLPGYKAYKTYNIKIHKIHFNRDVMFYEHIFPYVERITSSSPLPISNPCAVLTVNSSDTAKFINTPLYFQNNDEPVITNNRPNSQTSANQYVSPHVLMDFLEPNPHSPIYNYPISETTCHSHITDD